MAQREAAMSRYRADEATVWVWDEWARTCLKWRSAAHWDAIRWSLKDYFPRHCDLSYNGTRKLWSVPAHRRADLEHWLSWTFEPACVHWDEGEPAGRTYGRGRGHYGGQAGHTSTGPLEAAFKELHLLPTAPAWAAEAVFKAACRVHHPDVGGDGQTMTRINLAMEMIRASQRERRAS
jgi:hypothetical protein